MRSLSLILGGMILHAAFPLLASAAVSRRNPIETVYRPAVAALQSLHAQDQRVFAPPEFIFGRPGPYVFDARFGNISHRQTASIVIEKTDLKGTLNGVQIHNVGRYNRIETLLQKVCSPQFENSHYIVYSCRPSSPL